MKLWVRLDADSPRDPRVGRLAAALDIPTRQAFGLVVAVWCAMAEHAPDGDLSGIDAATLEEWAGWQPERKKLRGFFAKTFVSVFTSCGKDEAYSVQQGALLRRMKRDRNRHTNDPDFPGAHRENGPDDGADSAEDARGDGEEVGENRDTVSAETTRKFPADSPSTERNGTERGTTQHSTSPARAREAGGDAGSVAAKVDEHVAAVVTLVTLVRPEYGDEVRALIGRVRPTADSPVEARRLSWAMSLRSLVDPERGGTTTPALLGEAVRQFNANGGSLNWRSFTRYVESLEADATAAAAPPFAPGHVALVRAHPNRPTHGDTTFRRAMGEDV